MCVSSGGIYIYLTETNCDLRNCNAVAYTCGLHFYEDIKNIVLSFAAAVLCDSQIIVCDKHWWLISSKPQVRVSGTESVDVEITIAAAHGRTCAIIAN